MFAASNPTTWKWLSREFYYFFSPVCDTEIVKTFWIWGLFSGFTRCQFLPTGLILSVQCSSSEPAASWKQSVSLLLVSRPGSNVAPDQLKQVWPLGLVITEVGALISPPVSVSQVDLPGVLQPIQSADEAEGCVTRQEVDLQECSWETSSG